MVRLCFDYGHGGRDSGAVYKGRKESMDNLDIGRQVGQVVGLFALKVDETRTSDINMSLRERVDFANKGNYDYFISFHRNAFKPEQATGAETFIHPKASPKSRKLAEDIQRALVECGFKNRGVKVADFYLLRKTKMPAVLIEIGFIDNSRDNDLFDSKRKEIINQISKAIVLGSDDK